jgi:hypothetical protein
MAMLQGAFVPFAGPALQKPCSLSAGARCSGTARHARGGARGGGDIVDTAVAAGGFMATVSGLMAKAGVVVRETENCVTGKFAATDTAFY